MSIIRNKKEYRRIGTLLFSKLAFSLHLSEALAAEYRTIGLRIKQAATNRQEQPMRDVAANQSLENAGILDVFQIF